MRYILNDNTKLRILTLSKKLSPLMLEWLTIDYHHNLKIIANVNLCILGGGLFLLY